MTDTHLGQLLLSAQSRFVLVLEIVELGGELVLGLDSLGVRFDSSGVLLQVRRNIMVFSFLLDMQAR